MKQLDLFKPEEATQRRGYWKWHECPTCGNQFRGLTDRRGTPSKCCNAPLIVSPTIGDSTWACTAEQ